MTISISKNVLLAKLLQLSKIIPAKPTIPVLGDYLFETRGDRLYLTASNEEGRIMTSLECRSDANMSLCVPPSIVEGLKTLPEQPIEFHVNPDNKNIQVKYQGGKFEVVGYEAASYPKKREIEILDEIKTTPEELQHGISKVINFASENDLRPILTTVLIEAVPGLITFVASDGHGLGFLKKENKLCTGKISVTISRKIASVLKGILPLADEELSIQVGNEWSKVLFGDCEISFRNVEGRFPNWRSVIPESNDKLLLVDTKQLLGVIKRTSVFSNKVTSLIVFKLVPDQLTVSAQNIDFSTSAEETLSVEFKENEFNIGVNSNIIQEILSCIDNERSKLSFSDPSRAILITPEVQSAGEELTYLLMPMSINY